MPVGQVLSDDSWPRCIRRAGDAPQSSKMVWDARGPTSCHSDCVVLTLQVHPECHSQPPRVPPLSSVLGLVLCQTQTLDSPTFLSTPRFLAVEQNELCFAEGCVGIWIRCALQAFWSRANIWAVVCVVFILSLLGNARAAARQGFTQCHLPYILLTYLSGSVSLSGDTHLQFHGERWISSKTTSSSLLISGPIYSRTMLFILSRK